MLPAKNYQNWPGFFQSYSIKTRAIEGLIFLTH